MDDERWKAIEARLDAIDKRLKDMESERRPLIGGNIWVLVPVAAIIMWGLQNILL